MDMEFNLSRQAPAALDQLCSGIDVIQLNFYPGRVS